MNDNPIVNIGGKQVAVASVGRWIIEFFIAAVVAYIAQQMGSVHTGLDEVKRKQIVMEVQMGALIEDRTQLSQLATDVSDIKNRITVLETREGNREGNRGR